jgi:hypothetical protein
MALSCFFNIREIASITASNGEIGNFLVRGKSKRAEFFLILKLLLMFVTLSMPSQGFEVSYAYIS